MKEEDVKSKKSPPRDFSLSPNEQILAECHEIYADSEHGLVNMGKLVGLQLLAPRKKIIVMLIGNHSAGKSTFINWYIGEKVQRTGVAIETQGFTFVTSGKKRDTLTGKATLHLYPYYKSLERIKGVVDYMATEVVASNAKKFKLVTFVDTPGLVDGEMHYPYDVEKAILWLGNLADQIFVFFDPIGQALCRRTVNIAEKLNASHSEKIKFFLSKADEAGTEGDRQKVMMQIVQELCKRPGLNKAGFEMPTIYIPDVKLIRETQCVNEIETVVEQVDKAINYSIQNTLNALEKDCDQVLELIHCKIEEDNQKRSRNLKASIKGVSLGLFSLSLPLLLVLSIFSSSLSSMFSETTIQAIDAYLYPFKTMWTWLPPSYQLYAIATVISLTVILLALAAWAARIQPTLTRKDKKHLLEMRDFILNDIKPRKHELYTRYLSEIVMTHELADL